MKLKNTLIFLVVPIFLPSVLKGSISENTPARQQFQWFGVSLFNNQYYLPFAGVKNLFTSKYHPGLSIGLQRELTVKSNRVVYADLKTGVYHHRFIQTGIQLYGNLGYRYSFKGGFFIAAEYGLGYLHAIKHQTTFKADENGNYTRVKNFGRPQLMTGLGIKFGSTVRLNESRSRWYICYQPWFQMPFIKSYVPLLPNNSWHVGIELPINMLKNVKK